jgi:hypothetical protein
MIMYKLRLRLLHWLPRHLPLIEVIFLMACVFIASAQPAYAADVTRLQDRSMLVVNPNPGATTDLIISFTYATDAPIGSVEILFCISPIPDDPCNKPPGLNAANVTLDQQTGVNDYTIQSKTANRIVLTRTPSNTGTTPSTYRFKNFINPTANARSYGARLSTHLSTDASDPLPYVNLGSVLQQPNNGILLETQVPPILIFCLGGQVSFDCKTNDDIHYADMGTLSADNTLVATSQMAAATNATGGFVITANGPTLQSGTNSIRSLATPAPSRKGVAQFGLNLRRNDAPSAGGDPDGSWVNGTPAPNYNIPDSYTYNDGDIVASSPEVNLQRRFTVTYIVNAPDNLRPGIYTTSIAYVCSGRF